MNSYLTTIALVERLHRQCLEVVKAELDRHGVRDLSNVQAMILFNIGADELTIGELTQRGYYLGSNVSYNVKKMVENGYLIQERSRHDRRAQNVRLSDKALAVRAKMQTMYDRHISSLGTEISPLEQSNKQLLKLERFWNSQIGFVARSEEAA
ncbi:MAG: MarR family winged helix-turn-helix transcriptional regulator [Dongiaceae bacterium]